MEQSKQLHALDKFILRCLEVGVESKKTEKRRLSKLPRVPHLFRALRTRIYDVRAAGINLVAESSLFSPDEKVALYSKGRYHLKRAMTCFTKTATIVVLTFCLCFCLIVLGIPALVFAFQQPSYLPIASFLLRMVGGLIAGIPMLTGFIAIRFTLSRSVLKRAQSFRAIALSLKVMEFLLVGTVLFTVISFFIHPSRSGWQGVSYFFVLCLSAGSAAHYASLRFCEVVYRRQWKKVTRQNVDSLIIDAYIDLLRYVEARQQEWGRTEFTQIVVEKLESLAGNIEKGRTAALRTGKATSDDWLLQSHQQMAAAVRELERWVLTPKSDTRDHFRAILKSDLMLCLRGDWDSFRRSEPDIAPTISRWKSLISSWGKTLAVSLSLLTIVWCLHVKWIASTVGNAGNYLAIICIGLAGLTIIEQINPSLISKLSQLKDVFPAVGGVLGEKKNRYLLLDFYRFNGYFITAILEYCNRLKSKSK